MKGTHRIVVQNKRIRYDFIVCRNLTIIQGDSATGKTTLVEMIREYYENGRASGVELHCEKECAVLFGRNWKADLAMMQDSIIFIDEGNEFIFTDEFASFIQETDNYYVIVTREAVYSLPYSVEEIYGIHNSGKYGTLKRTYNEFYHLYQTTDYRIYVKPAVVITEDSNSGYQFFKAVCKKDDIDCFSADGKSNIFEEILKHVGETEHGRILVIGDGAAFGSDMKKITELMKEYKEITLYLPESFEWLILKAGIIEDAELKEILAEPSEYIDSRKYFSWERFFTSLLVNKTEATYLKYTKRRLNPVYLNHKFQDKILSVMEWILLEMDERSNMRE